MSTGAVPFAERAGVDLVELERGRVKMKIPFQGNQNHIGIMRMRGSAGYSGGNSWWGAVR